jgi:2-polyprenyl-3-methyl-5-hydroxy-6-metoxy-1,4-benzoquinol methylase
VKQHLLDDTRASWNFATKQHNAHKRAQAAFFRAGGSTLFPDEVELLGEVRGKSVLHVCCNAGQDSVSLSALGARVTGVDFSDEAIVFAQTLATDCGSTATFLHSALTKGATGPPTVRAMQRAGLREA